MIIGKSNCKDISMGLYHKLLEPESNTEASEYITSNYTKLLEIIKHKHGIKDEKAHDLLHDVFVSIVEAENDGRAFDMGYGIDEDEMQITSVDQFVQKRIGLYSKNVKYRTDVTECGKTKIERVICIETPAMDKNGVIRDRHGNIVTEKKYTKEKINVVTAVTAASYDESNDSMENNDSFQKAYAMASSADNISDLTDFYSLKEQIDFCIDFGSLHDVNVLNIFKNIDTISEMLGDFSKKKKKADNVFGKLTELVLYHTDFADALRSVIEYSATDRVNYESVLATY